MCQQQTKKAATFDAVWRFSGHHTHSYVSGSDVKKIADVGFIMMESSKEGVYCGVVFQNIELIALSDEKQFQ